MSLARPGPYAMSIPRETPIDILVIEDSDELRSILGQLFEEEGYAVVTADNGLLGVRLAEQLCPRLIVCDVMLPGMDGFAVRRACAETHGGSGPAFILVSASAQLADFTDGVPFLPKPFDLQDLLDHVRRQIGPGRQSALERRTYR